MVTSPPQSPSPSLKEKGKKRKRGALADGNAGDYLWGGNHYTLIIYELMNISIQMINKRSVTTIPPIERTTQEVKIRKVTFFDHLLPFSFIIYIRSEKT